MMMFARERKERELGKDVATTRMVVVFEELVATSYRRLELGTFCRKARNSKDRIQLG